MSTIDQAKIREVRQPKTDVQTTEPRRQPDTYSTLTVLLNSMQCIQLNTVRRNSYETMSSVVNCHQMQQRSSNFEIVEFPLSNARVMRHALHIVERPTTGAATTCPLWVTVHTPWSLESGLSCPVSDLLLTGDHFVGKLVAMSQPIRQTRGSVSVKLHLRDERTNGRCVCQGRPSHGETNRDASQKFNGDDKNPGSTNTYTNIWSVEYQEKH